ncbi:hypothetical protein [Paludisphaera soli]|uniref:hypothetical protein n=1 Tax=Paludisphaera soli TaxID=2712865 RepID=UPI0013EE07FF|nr:hypothetical protein [Paludisphaera soli]
MPDATDASGHGTLLFAGQSAPPSVELVRDDGSSESWNRFHSGPRLVVLPISADAISAAGNGPKLALVNIDEATPESLSVKLRGLLAEAELGRVALGTV